MAIFTNTFTKSDIDLPVYEGYGLENCEFMNIFTESFDDELALVEAIHSYDMTEILGTRKINAIIESKSAEDSDYEPEEDPEIAELKEELQSTLEAEGAKVKSKFVDKLKKIWAKIKAFFASIGRFFKNLGKSSSEFVAKYKRAIAGLKNVDFKHKMYEWKVDKLLAAVPKTLEDTANDINKTSNEIVSKINKDTTAEQLKEIKKTIDDDFKSYGDKFRGLIVNGSESQPVESGEYDVELFDYFRGKNAKASGKKEVQITNAKINEFVKFLEQSDNQENALRSLEKKIDNMYKAIIAEVNGLKEGLEKDDKKLVVIRKLAGVINSHSQLTTSTLNKWAGAVKSCASDYKSVISAAITKSGYELK